MPQDYQYEEHLMMQIEGLVAPRAIVASDYGADDETARRVAERLNEMTAQAERGQLRFSFAVILSSLGVIAGCVLKVKGGNIDSNVLVSVGNVLYVGSLLAVGGAFLALSQYTPTINVEEIGLMGGIRAIPPLFAALQSPLREAHEWAIYKALTALLPLITVRDANLLNLDARRAITRWLSTSDDFERPNICPDALRIAALKALGQVGYSRDIPLVERLAKMRGYTTGQARVRLAAIQCLPHLRANCVEVEGAHTLLRASQFAETQPETLLRPASTSGQTDAAELLRGAEKP